MEKLYSDQLSVTILPPATAYQPVDGRKYTLIMSNRDQMSHLAIGYKYEMTMLNADIEQILTAEWKPRLGEYMLNGKVHIGSNVSEEALQQIFEHVQLSVAKSISIIITSDKLLYTHVPWLLDAPIYIEINSAISKFKTIQYYGTPRQYLK